MKLNFIQCDSTYQCRCFRREFNFIDAAVTLMQMRCTPMINIDDFLFGWCDGAIPKARDVDSDANSGIRKLTILGGPSE